MPNHASNSRMLAGASVQDVPTRARPVSFLTCRPVDDNGVRVPHCLVGSLSSMRESADRVLPEGAVLCLP